MSESSVVRQAGVRCPSCGEGTLLPSLARGGVVYRCSNRPFCRYRLQSRPIGRRCTCVRDDGYTCGAMMVEGTKTIPDRCSDRECPNHFPERLAG